MRRTIASISLTTLLFPLALFAEVSEELRAQIRANLLEDPRTAELSSVELDAMVTALAEELESQGTTAEYLESQNSFDVASLFSPLEPPSVFMQMVFSPLGLAVALLVALLAAITIFIIRRRGRPIPSDAL